MVGLGKLFSIFLQIGAFTLGGGYAMLAMVEQAIVEKHKFMNKVRLWLQCFTAPWRNGHIKYGSKEIRDQIKAVYDAGYEEWILWNASNRYDYVKEALLMDELP